MPGAPLATAPPFLATSYPLCSVQRQRRPAHFIPAHTNPCGLAYAHTCAKQSPYLQASQLRQWLGFMMVPASSYLRVERSAQAPPRLLITSPRARMPALLVIAVMLGLRWAWLSWVDGHGWGIVLFVLVACALHAVWIPGRRSFWLEVTRSEWRMVHRRGFWGMLPWAASTAAGHTSSLSSAEVRPRRACALLRVPTVKRYAFCQFELVAPRSVRCKAWPCRPERTGRVQRGP